MSELTVVIPAYKSEKVLDRTLNSILKQEKASFSIIVVEDGILDNTAEVVNRRPNVRLLQKETNQGVASARNSGLELVLSPYVIFIDSDDYVEGNYFRSALDQMNKQKLDLLLAPWRVVHETGGAGEMFCLPEQVSCYDVLCRFLSWDFSAMTTPARVFWRTDTLRELGGWNEKLRKREDENLVIRGLTSGLNVGSSKHGLCNYWKPADGVCRSANNMGKSEAFHETMDMIYQFSADLDSSSKRQWIRKLMGERSYKQAYIDYCGGYDRQGQRWLRRARLYGFRGHDGSMAHKIAATVLGLDLKFRISRRGHRVIDRIMLCSTKIGRPDAQN